MTKNKILIVEDERITAEDLKNTLEMMGYEVTGMASSADTFYKSLQAKMPDLVLMDIYLKGKKDGIELATEVKEKYQLPVIYLTAYSDANILDRAKITEPFGYILKPFQERELYSNIEMALHKNRMEHRINHLNAILKAIRDINQLIVRVSNVKELLDKTCETLVSTRAYASSWFITLDAQGKYLESASAGCLENLEVFIQQYKAGNTPKCIDLLNATNQQIYALNDIVDCTGCSIKKMNSTHGTIISKVEYKDRIYGYLAVSLPIELISDKEETELLIEITGDLSLALNNLEQQKKKTEVEESLKNSEEQLRLLINAMPDLVCFKDGEGRWLVANDYAINLFELQGVDYFGKTDTELAEYSSFYKETFLQCEETDAITWEKQAPTRADKIIPRPDGTFLIFDSIKMPSFDVHGKPKGLVVVERDITERKIAEQNLVESDEQYRTFINSSTDLVGLKDEQLKYVMVNENLRAFFNKPEVDILGKNDTELMPPEIAEICRHSDEQVLASLNGGIFTELFGDKIYESHKFPVKLTDGKTGVGSFIRDVSEQVHSKVELLKLSQVVLQSPESIVVTDTNGIIEYANPAACLISGYAIEELVGTNPRVLKSGKTSAEEYKAMWETIKTGNEWKGEFHNRKKNGDLYWERALISPIKNPNGEITHFLSVKEDITERKHTEGIQKVLYDISRQAFETTDLQQLLEIVKNELSTLINTNNFFVAFYNEATDMLSMAYRVDERDTFTVWPAEKSLTGYVVRNNKSVMLKSDGFQKLIEDGEVELFGADSEIWLGVPLTVDGKPYGAIVVQDYQDPNAYTESDLRMLEFIASQVSLSIQRQKSILDIQNTLVKAEASDKLKTAFINNISHEIRTPLNGILGFTEMSLNPDTTQEDHELFFSVIKKSSKRLLNTINSYMDISMLVSGTMEISRRPSNLDKLIKEIAIDFSDISASKGIELIARKHDFAEPMVVNTDIEKLRKILTHLLDNAFKFTQKGVVTFGYDIKDHCFEFKVSDTGTGIKTDALSVIFDAFMQADVSSTRGYEGSGLGLTIANGLVKLLGGNLRVDTERGKGSTFYFTLPFAENTILTPQKVNVAPKPDESVAKPLILVAEDDDSNYKYIEIVLLYAAYNVIRAENGIEAVECLRKHPEISLVLMDIKMPVMDGFEATRQIRTFMPELPIIALTAHVTAEDENLAISSGCNEYVTKPVSKAKLLEIIEESLDMNKSAQVIS